ncbi:MAG: hypothetical protein JW779_12685 [Candidatus Thorarchaeota archaeon]|nr:hypothetical protein [Candidatus Thorarchaeota archaeon]
MAKTRYSSYEGDKATERPVRLDKTEGHIVIEGRAYPARELIEALAQSGYAELRSVGDSIVLGSKRITPIFKSRQDRAMASLCHGSLSYCCPLSKRCAERDRALEVLGLTPEEYESLKRDAHFRFVETARGIGTEDSQWDTQTSRERIANRPAVDYGYGSDDYRRDFESLGRSMDKREEPFDGRLTNWPQSRDDRYPPQNQEREDRESRDIYADLQGAVPTKDDLSCSVCNIQRDESVDGIGALFAQGELSPFLDDAREDNQEQMFCFSCGRNIRKSNRVCPYCGARQ